MTDQNNEPDEGGEAVSPENLVLLAQGLAYLQAARHAALESGKVMTNYDPSPGAGHILRLQGLVISIIGAIDEHVSLVTEALEENGQILSITTEEDVQEPEPMIRKRSSERSSDG